MASRSAEIRAAATTAGIALLVMAIVGGFANFAVLERLVVEGDAARTAANLADSEELFRLAVAGLLVVALLDVVVAWALFRVLEPANPRLSMLTAWFRVTYSAIFAVAIAHLIRAAGLLPASTDEALLASVESFRDIWTAALFVFALHLILLGVLMVQATHTPTPLGVLLVVAGLGYAVDGFGQVLVAAYDANVAAFTFVGEIVLIFWLLLRGRRLRPESIGIGTPLSQRLPRLLRPAGPGFSRPR